ncbi:MAG: threonine ammonia-lyase [Alphaproteobacteria bacterium]|nr:threonine ammonia-lyase [Alphaproteobacteria bacterium]
MRLSKHMGIDLYLKLENLQHTNAFKARGALNKLLTLNEEQRKNGVIACSAGNHAQGVAYHATRLGIPSTIVMPIGTPFNKIQRTEDFGAKVVLYGKTFDEGVGETMRLAEENNYTFIHPFADDAVIAGQGTLGMEMMEDMPDLDVIVVPIGGGGMIAGVATAVKAMKPEVQVIGAQAELYDAVIAHQQGRSGGPAGGATLAEGIAVKSPSEENMEIIDKLVDRVDSASEQQIEKAVFDFLSNEKLVAEGAAGAGLAVIQKNLSFYKGKKVGLVLCGGNIDSRLLSTLILRGLVHDGRICRLRFEIDDTPGQLSAISGLIGKAGANVIEVIHQRMMQSVSLKQAELDIVIEARDFMHVEDIVKTIRDAGISVQVMSEV